jgi:hypothetical protein
MLRQQERSHTQSRTKFITTMRAFSITLETHAKIHARQRTHKIRGKKRQKNRRRRGWVLGATKARPGGGFGGHLKYYINRRDCVRAQLTSELQKITILHEIPPFWGSILTPKNTKFGPKTSFFTLVIQN